MKNKKIELALRIFATVVSLAVILLALLSMLGVGDFIYIYLPLAGLSQALLCLLQWNAARGVAIANLVCAGIIFVCTALLFVL